MQLNLAFTCLTDQPQPPKSPATTPVAASPWQKLDPAVQADALQILARLIAAVLAAGPALETHHE